MTNKYLAMFSEQSQLLKSTQREAQLASINTTITEATQLAQAASQALNLSITEEAQRFYGLLLASSSTDEVSAASGAELAETVVKLVSDYYAGDIEALQPVVDATNMWIAANHEGVAKTANIPNNLRLLVSRKSQAYAEENELRNKLTLSVEGEKGSKKVIIKEAPLKPTKKATAAQKVFASITKLDTMEIDELIQVIAADGKLANLFASLAPVANTNVKAAPNKEAAAQIQARIDAAVNKEDRLMDELDFASEAKLKIVDDLNEKREELEENEKLLTAKRIETEQIAIKLKRARKDEVKTALADDLEVAQTQLGGLLEINHEITSEVNRLAKEAEKAIATLNSAEEAYNVQADHVASLTKQLSQYAH